MGKALQQAFDLLFSSDAELWNIVSVTMRMTLTSSIAALLLGAPLGVLYAGARFPGRKALIVLNRTLMGVPPVVCGLIFYLLFSGVGRLAGVEDHILMVSSCGQKLPRRRDQLLPFCSGERSLAGGTGHFAL